MISLDGILSPGHLIIPALMLAIDLHFLLVSFKFNWSDELSLNKMIKLSSIKRKTPTIMGRMYMVNTRLWSFKFKGSSMFSSVTQMCPSLLRPHGLQYTRPPSPSPTPGAYSNSCPLSRWCHPTISFSVIPFSTCFQSYPASRSFPLSQFFTPGGQNIGVLASALVFPMNIQGWFPLGWTGWISLLSKGLSRVFSNTTVQKHQFLSTQLSL